MTTKALLQPTRTITLLMWSSLNRRCCFRVADGKTVDRYTATEVDADFGRGFLVAKQGQNPGALPYRTNLGGAPMNGDSCTCKGHIRWGKCRHASGLRTLIARGKIQ